MRRHIVIVGVVAVLASAGWASSAGYAATPSAAGSGAVGTGSITVQLTDPHKQPIDCAARTACRLAGAEVDIERPDGSIWGETAIQNTSGGSFTFTGVPAGAGWSSHVHPLHSSPYIPSVKTFTVTAGQHLALDQVMQWGGTIAGSVTGPDGTPLAGADVAALTSNGAIAQWGVTDSSGAYAIQGLPSGAYAVEFNARVGDQPSLAAGAAIWSFFPNASTAEASTPVAVSAQTATAAASTVDDVSGSVTAGYTLTVLIDDNSAANLFPAWGVISGTARGTSFVTPVTTLVGLQSGYVVRLATGEYDLGLTPYPGSATTYWYAGAGRGAQLQKSQAVLVRFDGTTDATITIH